MITLSMTPYQIKKEMSIDIKNNIIPYLNTCFDDEFGIPGGHTVL